MTYEQKMADLDRQARAEVETFEATEEQLARPLPAAQRLALERGSDAAFGRWHDLCTEMTIRYRRRIACAAARHANLGYCPARLTPSVEKGEGGLSPPYAAFAHSKISRALFPALRMARTVLSARR